MGVVTPCLPVVPSWNEGAASSPPEPQWAGSTALLAVLRGGDDATED